MTTYLPKNLMEPDEMYNVDSAHLPLWSRALGKLRSGFANARIACIGDSTTFGIGANSGDGHTNQRIKSYPTQLAKALSKAYNINAHSNSIFCDGFEGANIVNFDPRLTLGAGWGISTTFVAGGNAFIDNSTTSPEFKFDPGVTTNTLDVYYVTFPGYADFIVTSGGNFVDSAQTNGPVGGGIGKLTVNRESVNSPWVIQKSATTPNATLLIVGVDAYDSTEKVCSVWNMGASGSKVSHWVADPAQYAFQNAIKVLAPDLSIINLCINDWAQGTTMQWYKDDLQKIIDACKVSGDVILVVAVPSNAGTASEIVQQEYAGYVYELAEANDLPLLNLTKRWVAQDYRPDRDFYYDGLHPNGIGNADIANFKARAVGAF